MAKISDILFYIFQVLTYFVGFLIAAYVAVMIWAYYFDTSAPTFFPLDDPEATYTIAVCEKEAGLRTQYCVTYEGDRSMFIDSTTSVLITSPDIDITQYMNANVATIDGSFVSANQICYLDDCEQIRKGVVLEIEGVTLREE